MSGLGTQLRHLLARLDGDVQAIYNDLGAEFRPRFFPVVQQLLSCESMSVSAIAQEAGVSQPAMTQTLSEMAKLGLVTTNAGVDARQRHVRLTDKARAAGDRLQPVWQGIERAAAELDSELPASLSDVIGAALSALDRKPFRRRIEERLP